MGVVTYEMEVATVIPPARLFKAFVLDGHNLMPKVAPHAIQSIEFVEGDGGPGSIKKITFGEVGQFSYLKQKVDVVDKESWTYNYTVIEGDVALMNGSLEKIVYESKLVAGPDGGSICKSISNYYCKGDFKITEDQIKAGKEKGVGLFKAVEAYLLANPDAYN